MIDDELKHIYPPFNRKDGIFLFWRIALSNVGEVFHTVGGRYYQYTRNFCEAVGMTDEDTMIWVLKFGDTLPMYYLEGKVMPHGN